QEVEAAVSRDHTTALQPGQQHESLSQNKNTFLSQKTEYRLFVFVFSLSLLQGKVWLIDFNPFGEVTDSLLFTWEELISENNLNGDFSEVDAQEQDSPAFRCTNSEVTVQPSPYLSYRLPKDFVDLSTGEDAHKLIDFLKLKRNQQEDD
ncbi:cell division cycle protein 123 homolog, partial [Piliocolobus tephrosceles]|uniref:cell division cycle protein 123 homolog n=1 Tax=Piliocolobus tephrosceles TaxID=591936 RepID=UPI000C299B6E